MQIWCLAVSMLWCPLFVADLIVGMEELELHYRRRGRSNFRKIRTATISVRIVTRARKTNKQKHFGRDGVRDKQELSLGQTGPLPGTNWDPSLGQTGLFLLNSTVKPPFCPVCPWDGWGFVPGTIAPQGPSENCLCVFC